MGLIWRVLVMILVLSVGFGESALFPNPRNARVQSERGSALVLPLVGSHQRGRGLREEDARMTLHDDLLTKGCEFFLSCIDWDVGFLEFEFGNRI